MRRLLACLLAVSCSTVSPVERSWIREITELVHQKTFSGVVIVARERQHLVELAEGNTTLATRFDIASLGKMFTAVAVAQLVDEFDKPVAAYLPSFPNADIANRVTLHHLLTHTSGIPDLPDDLFNAPPPTLQGYLPFFTNAKLEFDPGAQRSYSNAGFVLLGMIIEAVSGEPYEQYVRKNVFAPAGMTATARGPHGGALSTAADLVRFFDALRRGRLVKQPTLTRITTPPAYGFGVLEFGKERLVGHSGGSTGISADAYLYWQSGYAVIVLSNMAPPASHEIAGAIRKMIEPQF